MTPIHEDPDIDCRREDPLTGHRENRGQWAGIWLLALGAVTLISMVAGCGTSNPHALGTYERGAYWVEAGRYQDAADAFEIFVRQHPTDSLAVLAQFEKSRAYMAIKEYPLAAVELQILAQDYPVSPLVEDAMFYEGECYYFQVGRIERDVTPAYEARIHWLEFSRQYPTSKYMPQVRHYMQEIADLMVEKSLRAVKVYQQLRRWQAAAITLERVLEEEPASNILDEVMWLRAEAAKRLEEPEMAKMMYQRLINEYPDSRYHEAARQELGVLMSLDDDDEWP